MKLTHFKYLFSLVIFLGLFLASCTNTTEPVDSIRKVEYVPKISEAEDLAKSLVNESFKTSAESFVGTDLMRNAGSLGKSADERTYNYVANWHVWKGDIETAVFDIPDSYNAEYLAKIQFQNNGIPQQSSEGAQLMLMYLNAHTAFGFVNDEPYGDEYWYDFQGAASPLNGWPSVINAGGEYERRWVGLYSEDNENWEELELHYKVQVDIENVQFFYDWNINDFYLNGIVTVYGNGFKVLIRFTNSRTAMMETYQNGTLVRTAEFALPNFYEMMNIPSLENWNFGADFLFPLPILF